MKFELVDQFYDTDSDDPDLDAERKEFLQLAKAEKGISREVLVPGNMNLHAMHYMIQRLFGWLNGHLHNFSLSDEDFNAITSGRVGGWKKLCGSLLHFPTNENSDFFWDDDYKTGQSVRTWYKKKYTGPYAQKAVCETYYNTMRELKIFQEKNPGFASKMPLWEMQSQLVFEEPLNFLNERLTLDELLVNGSPRTEMEKRREYRNWLAALEQKKKETEALIEGIDEKKRAELDDALENLVRWRDNKAYVEQMIYMGRTDELFEQTGTTAQDWLKEAEYFISRSEKKCKKLFTDCNPKLDPLFDTLYYEYDYGDGWFVKISVVEKYETKKEAAQACEELAELIDQVKLDQAPRCIAADGINVLDDVGGIGGFHDMLSILNGDDQEEIASTKSWARGLGWTGRLTKPDRML